MSAPRSLGYAICTEMRSGSTYLCELLSSTGVLGRPYEFFKSHDWVRVEHDAEFLKDIIKRGSTPNGVFGIKLFSYQFDATRKSKWIEKCNVSKFVFLRREDILGQAISCVRALQTQQYLANERARRKPVYDKNAIHRHLLRVTEGYSRWEAYFARNGLDPLRLSYEGFIRDPLSGVQNIASYLGTESTAGVDFRRVTATVQSDAITDEWRARFIEESRDLSNLDHVLGDTRIWLRRRARDLWYVSHKLGLR